ncbi:MAG: response regulator [Planctomycetes bacterium]|nr:response regulator [Planctomycetota bacterium]
MLRVLLVEDNDLVRESVAAMLEVMGCRPILATDGRSVRRELGGEPNFDIVLTDIFMPESDGLETIREIRKQWPDMPIVAMSGGSDLFPNPASYLEAARTFGAVEALSKPFGLEELRAAILRALPEAQLAEV